MNFLKKLAKGIDKFEDMFMTNHACISCGVEIPDGSRFSLCHDCQNKISIIDGYHCRFCGDRVFGPNMVCDSCKRKVYEFANNRSCFFYDEVSSKIVKNLKYNSRKYIAPYMAELMLARSEYFKDVDIITFVPINKSRLRERGFNQSQLLAEYIGNKLGIETLNLLIKKEGGKHQAGLDMKQRLSNPFGTYEFDEENISKVKGKKVLIIDDVFTTGSTLSECARMIKKLKPYSVRTVTFAKTDFNSSN